MIIDLDPKTRIKGLESCWALQRKRNRAGTDSWQSYKWFTSFGRALEEAVQHEIRTHPAYGLAEALEAVAELVQRYEKLIPAESKIARSPSL